MATGRLHNNFLPIVGVLGANSIDIASLDKKEPDMVDVLGWRSFLESRQAASGDGVKIGINSEIFAMFGKEPFCVLRDKYAVARRRPQSLGAWLAIFWGNTSSFDCRHRRAR